MALQVLEHLKNVLKEDAGLDLNVAKTSVLPKDVSQKAAFDVVQNIIQATPTLNHLSGDVTIGSFCPEGFVGIGVPIGTDTFVRNFVAKTCRAIIDDVEKLDAIQDGFIHYQLLRFCQATRLQYLNSHILLGNRCVLQQQHVDCKIADALLKKSTKQHADGWDASSKAWAHMILHLSHAQGGFGVTFNDITKDAAFYTTTSRFVAWLGAFSQERQSLWLPKDDLKDSSTWSSPPLVLLRDIHDGLLAKYDCKDSVPPPAQPGARARPARDSQDGLDGASQQEAAPLFLPQLNQLHELSFVRGEDASNVVAIPTQHRVTQQILSRWQPFKDLKQTFAVSRRAEQLRLRVQQRVIATVEDSALRTEMENLESDEEDTSRRVLWYKPMS